MGCGEVGLDPQGVRHQGQSASESAELLSLYFRDRQGVILFYWDIV